MIDVKSTDENRKSGRSNLPSNWCAHSRLSSATVRIFMAFILLLLSSPVLARFLEPDPAREFVNPYSYVGNNPIIYIDPTGCSHVAEIVAAAYKLKEQFSADNPVQATTNNRFGDKNSVIVERNPKGRYASNSNYMNLGFCVNKCNLFPNDAVNMAYQDLVFPKNSRKHPITANQLGQYFNRHTHMVLNNGSIMIEVTDPEIGDIVIWYTSDTQVLGGHFGIVVNDEILLSDRVMNAHTDGTIDENFVTVDSYDPLDTFSKNRYFRILDEGDAGYDAYVEVDD